MIAANIKPLIGANIMSPPMAHARPRPLADKKPNKQKIAKIQQVHLSQVLKKLLPFFIVAGTVLSVVIGQSLCFCFLIHSQ